MGLLAKEKRQLADEALSFAVKGNFKKASLVRQKAYALNPPGSIGIDWGDWRDIWSRDKKYLSYLENERFSDLINSRKYKDALRAVIFVEYLFGFRDGWSYRALKSICPEQMNCPMLNEFRRKMDWVFESEPDEIIYIATAKRNLETKMYISSDYYSSAPKHGINVEKHPHMTHIYENGEYYLGVLKGTPKEHEKRILDGRRKFLQDVDLFDKMQGTGIEKFPKTFQTFQKHKQANDEKYQEWMRQYNVLKTERPL